MDEAPMFAFVSKTYFSFHKIVFRRNVPYVGGNN